MSGLSHLDRLQLIVQCVACGGACRATRHDTDAGLGCSACPAFYPLRDGVLVLDAPRESAEVLAEREGVVRTERDAALGGINDDFDDLARAEGPLKEALLALPEGDDSRYYREPGYFLNVRNSLRGFRFVRDRLGDAAGRSLLDIGADLTWSTNRLARDGFRCTALDINHHLAVGELFQARYGVPYDMVRADMHAAAFQANAFDVVVAFNALHHSGKIDRVASNIARVLAPGGRFAGVEPYCLDAARKAEFGQAQIDAGINEHTYLLDEWHRAFAGAGLVLEEVMVADACNMIYRKPRSDDRITQQATLLERAYAGRLVAGQLPPVSGPTMEIRVDVTNTSNATWCSEGSIPVRASYHLSRRSGAVLSLVAFDNRRSPVPDLRPGTTTPCVITVDVPSEAGEYLLALDLVQEGVCWFADRGFGSAEVSLRVARD